MRASSKRVDDRRVRDRARRRRIDRLDAGRDRSAPARAPAARLTVVTQSQRRARRMRATPASRARAASGSSSSTTTSCRFPTSSKSICARPRAIRPRIVRGGAIEVESLDDLPPPIWSIENYSGNYFWTTNVSVPLATIRAIGGFDESFSEYGWEDIDVGLRLRARGVKAVFHPAALVYHYKPRPRADERREDAAQSRAQARTAVRLVRAASQLARLPRDRNQSGAARIPRRCCGACGSRIAFVAGSATWPATRELERARAARRARAGERGVLRGAGTRAAIAPHVRILLSRTDRIGDLVLSTPAIATVRASFPDAHLAIVTSEYNRVVMERNDDVDELIVLPPRRLAATRSARSLPRYDVAIALAPRAVDLQLVGGTRARRARRLHVRTALVCAAHGATVRQSHHDLRGRSGAVRSRSARASCGTRSCSCSIWSRSPARDRRV